MLICRLLLEGSFTILMLQPLPANRTGHLLVSKCLSLRRVNISKPFQLREQFEQLSSAFQAFYGPRLMTAICFELLHCCKSSLLYPSIPFGDLELDESCKKMKQFAPQQLKYIIYQAKSFPIQCYQ